MHQGWGCCYHHRLSFVTEAENESVLLIALKIFIHLCWRQRGATQARGIRGLVLHAERWFWTRWRPEWRNPAAGTVTTDSNFPARFVKRVIKTCEKCYLVVPPWFRAARISLCGYLTQQYLSNFIHFHILKHRLKDKSDLAFRLKYNDIP